MHGLERLHASLDQFFRSMALNDQPIGHRVTECFCETIIADGTLKYLPASEAEGFEQLMKYHLGVGLNDFDEDYMQELFVTRDYFTLNQFVSSLFDLKGRLHDRLVRGET